VGDFCHRLGQEAILAHAERTTVQA
jgi:hypothetical protein